ncbi:MAG: orotidine-5'-phosphate decarboxylase [Pseudomonadota bacterium]
MAFTNAQSRLILALDVPNVAAAERLVDATRGEVGVYKIGLELALAGGLPLAQSMATAGLSVFLDMKLLDIANTVAGGVRSAGTLGVKYLTVHAYPQALAAAVAARPPGLSVVAVTVLTSLHDVDLAAAGYTASAKDLVATRIASAVASRADAIVCSPQEAALAAGRGLAVITPGVRLPEDSPNDQKRIATPGAAIQNGADAVVVGRPITAAPDPAAAAKRYRTAIEAALATRG